MRPGSRRRRPSRSTLWAIDDILTSRQHAQGIVKFKIDENLPSELAVDLRNLGHEANTVFDEGLAGAADPVLIAAATAEKRLLLTLNKGIANLRQYPAAQPSGVVLFRPLRSGRRSVLEFVRERLTEVLQLDLTDRLTVVGPTRIRVR